MEGPRAETRTRSRSRKSKACRDFESRDSPAHEGMGNRLVRAGAACRPVRPWPAPCTAATAPMAGAAMSASAFRARVLRRDQQLPGRAARAAASAPAASGNATATVRVDGSPGQRVLPAAAPKTASGPPPAKAKFVRMATSTIFLRGRQRHPQFQQPAAARRGQRQRTRSSTPSSRWKPATPAACSRASISARPGSTPARTRTRSPGLRAITGWTGGHPRGHPCRIRVPADRAVAGRGAGPDAADAGDRPPLRVSDSTTRRRTSRAACSTWPAAQALRRRPQARRGRPKQRRRGRRGQVPGRAPYSETRRYVDRFRPWPNATAAALPSVEAVAGVVGRFSVPLHFAVFAGGGLAASSRGFTGGLGQDPRSTGWLLKQR